MGGALGSGPGADAKAVDGRYRRRAAALPLRDYALTGHAPSTPHPQIPRSRANLFDFL